jgi:superfamily II DNA or RNA helicase
MTELFPHQRKIAEWIIRNNYTGILSIAPGAGVWYALLGAIKELPPDQIVILVVPHLDLVDQYDVLLSESGVPDSDFVVAGPTNDDWQTEIEKLGQKTKAPNDQHPNQSLLGSEAPNIVVATLQTVRRQKNEFDRRTANQILIIDEVESTSDLILSDITELASRRLGVTSLPPEWFENQQGDEIKRHFGEQTYAYSIEQAIADDVLNRYEYIPIVARLSLGESENYQKLQKKISRMYASNKGSNNQTEVFQATLQQQQLQVDAEAKYRKLRDLLRTGVETPILIVAERVKQVNKIEEIIESGLSGQSSEYGTPMKCLGKTEKAERVHMMEKVFGDLSDQVQAEVVIATHATIPDSPTWGAR